MKHKIAQNKGRNESKKKSFLRLNLDADLLAVLLRLIFIVIFTYSQLG